MRTRVVAIGFVLLLGVAGCLGGPGTGTAGTGTPETTESPATGPISATTESPGTGPTTATDVAATDTMPGADTTTDSRTPTPARSDGNVTVEYVVRAGDIPEDVASVNVTLVVAFADHNIYHCDGDMGSAGGHGFGTPTPTPYLDHDVDCLRYGNVTLDLTDLEGSRSIGSYTVPASAVGEYALVVRDMTVTLENGTTVEDVYAEHFRAHTVREPRSRTVGVAIGVTERPPEATARPHRTRHADSPYESRAAEFTPGDVETPVRYRLATGGSVAEGEQLAVRVSRDGDPAAVSLDVVGAAEDRYHTGPDGVAAVEITSPDIVEIEVKTDD